MGSDKLKAFLLSTLRIHKMFESVSIVTDLEGDSAQALFLKQSKAFRYSVWPNSIFAKIDGQSLLTKIEYGEYLRSNTLAATYFDTAI